MKTKILILYKDWLLHTRGEVRPEVGDKIKVPQKSVGGMTNKTIMTIKKINEGYIQCWTSSFIQYNLKNCYVEIEVDNLNFIK